MKGPIKTKTVKVEQHKLEMFDDCTHGPTFTFVADGDNEDQRLVRVFYTARVADYAYTDLTREEATALRDFLNEVLD